MVSFNVTSLFTCIPSVEAVDTVRKPLQYDDSLHTRTNFRKLCRSTAGLYSNGGLPCSLSCSSRGFQNNIHMWDVMLSLFLPIRYISAFKNQFLHEKSTDFAISINNSEQRVTVVDRKKEECSVNAIQWDKGTACFASKLLNANRVSLRHAPGSNCHLSTDLSTPHLQCDSVTLGKQVSLVTLLHVSQTLHHFWVSCSD